MQTYCTGKKNLKFLNIAAFCTEATFPRSIALTPRLVHPLKRRAAPFGQIISSATKRRSRRPPPRRPPIRTATAPITPIQRTPPATPTRTIPAIIRTTQGITPMIRATIRMTPVITQKNNLQNMACKMFGIPYFAFLKTFLKFFLKKGLQFRKRCGIIIKPSDEAANRIVGVDYNEGPPVPIPNTEVKLVCAENTRLATARR